MRTLVCALLLAAAAYGQISGPPHSIATDSSLLSSSRSGEAPDSGAVAASESLALPAAPSAALTANPSPAMLPVTSTVVARIDQPEAYSARNKKIWYSLAFVANSAAVFDAWTTRQVITSGKGVEANPLMKPFAQSSALYPALQIGPLAADYVGLRMMHSHNPVLRRVWWLPQTMTGGLSIACGVHNLGVAHR